MSSVKQQTIAADAGLEGTGLHTGEQAQVRFRPAPVGHRIRFRRMDVDGRPEILVDLEHVGATDRGTTLAAGDVTVQTVEHLLGAIGAHQIDNLAIEIHGPEVPIMDGSFRPFFEVLRSAGLKKQDRDAEVLELRSPVDVTIRGGASYVAVPAPALRVSATIEFDHPLIGRQYGSFDVTPETFAAELAPARTFGFLREADELRARGLARGATGDNAVVLDEEGLAAGELRFADEFVRHKVGDIVGDLAVVGRRIAAHIVADRPSHAGNLSLAREFVRVAHEVGAPVIDVNRIMEHLPHRYPMLLVDRILDFEPGRRIVGIKNVTINEPFFQGHYPGHPVMPGVLIIEAMAQVGGMLLMDTVDNQRDKVVYFMALDNVKWRRPVTPGDQLRFELELVQLRRQVCRMRGVGLVEGHVVAEAEMLARIVDR